MPGPWEYEVPEGQVIFPWMVSSVNIRASVPDVQSVALELSDLAAIISGFRKSHVIANLVRHRSGRYRHVCELEEALGPFGLELANANISWYSNVHQTYAYLSQDYALAVLPGYFPPSDLGILVDLIRPSDGSAVTPSTNYIEV
eukprot:scaffold51192_cov39-Prasinocladus_malaysianus.AAC.1